MDSINTKESLVISVCPISRYGNYFVTASGVGNKDTESSLKIYKFDTQNHEDPIRLLSQVKVSVNFSSIAWTKYGEDTQEHFMGFIVGGHQDGSVSLWDAAIVFQAKENKKLNYGLIQSKKFHNSSVNCIKFNQKANLFATGSKDVVLIAIEKSLTLESAMKCPSQDDNEITSLSWNDKVSHILAAATTTGTIYIWEMRKTELFLTITDQGILGDTTDEDYSRKENINTTVAWCGDGVQIVLAFEHPEYTFLTQYHMKQPHAPSAEYYGGHTQPIYCLAKNPNDPNFLLSLGRDDTVTCWSLRSQKPLVSITLPEKASSIVWLNKTPDCFIAVSYEGILTHHQVNFSSENALKSDTDEAPPRWLFKKSGVAFAFGNKFATFSDKTPASVTVHSLLGNQELAHKMKTFIEKIQKADLTEVLDEKISIHSKNPRDKNFVLFWVALKCGFVNNYNELFRAMGFDKTKLQNEVFQYIGKKVEKVPTKKERQIVNVNNNDEAEKLFSEGFRPKQNTENKEESKQETNLNEKPLTIQETVIRNINWNQGVEKLIKQSLLIGDLESAVDVALKCGRDAEALLIASAGDKELFNKAKESFFNKNKDLYIKNIFSSIINGNFDNLFDYNVLKDWKEYILYAKTYQKDQEFVQFANNIGDRLANNPDIYMALVCYVLGQNYNKCIDLLYNNYLKETEKLSKNDKKFYMQHLFEQVIAVKSVMNHETSHEKTDKIISEYCELLIDEGLFVEACTYLIKIKNNNHKILTLYDRLYNHCDYKLGKQFAKLQPPFNIVTVKPKVEKKVIQQQVKKPLQGMGKDQQGQRDLFDDQGGKTNVTKGGKSVFPQPEKEKLHSGNVRPPVITPTPLIKPDFPREKTVPNHQPFPQPNLNKPMVPKTIVPPKITKPVHEIQEEEKPIVKPTPFNPSGSTIKPPQPFVPKVNYPDQKSKVETPSQFTKTAEKLQSPQSTTSQQLMNSDEEFVYNAFDRYVNSYNSVYTDENKQKDFYNRVSALFTKLKNHEIKVNLLKLLVEFVNMFDNDASSSDLKKMQLKIQANGWDQNKTWMSCIEKLVNMPKNK